VPESLAKELTQQLAQSQSQGSLNIIVSSPRVQSAMRHIRPGTMNATYVPETLMPQSTNESRKKQPSLTAKQQEMQRQHNLLKAKFAKYQMMKPKMQTTKSLSDLL